MKSLAEQFRKIAEEDFEVACLLFAAEKAPGAVCFHSQQCIEKLLKAALALRGVKPEHTHNVIALSERLTAVDPSWNPRISELALLAPAAVEYRYPGSPPTQEDAKQTLELVKSLRNSLLPYVS